MSDLLHASFDDRDAIDSFAAGFRTNLPGYQIAALAVNGETLLHSTGVAYHWPVAGNADVWIPKGTRTQEGDGDPLPGSYRSIAVEKPLLAALEALRSGDNNIDPAVREIVRAIVRRADGGWLGEIRSDLTRIQERWPDVWHDASNEIAHALAMLRDHADDVGISEQQHGCWERLQAGDLLVSTPDTPWRVRGTLRLWRIEDRRSSRFPRPLTIRRLRHLRDTAGGCGPGERAFRRLALPWLPAGAEETPDGDNRLNSHAVNIAARLSRTHFHPEPPVGGGAPQWELYVVLKPPPTIHSPTNASPQLHTFADLSDWDRCTVTMLQPGDVVAIPPNIAHRGLDVLANVIAIPGFKPSNEIYVDHVIATATARRGRFNPEFAGAGDRR